MAYTLKSEASKLKEGVVFDPLIFLVDRILYSAISMHASDIHLEQRSTDMRVRYRIDGILYDQDAVNQEQSFAILSRLKILASLDIAQKRLPQDGKFLVNFSSRDIDLRVSTFPSIYGEKMVIRILDRCHSFLSLEKLGFSKNVFEKVTKLINLPHGLFIVTGPTGSGKSTTLYAILSKLNSTERNIVTMEDPVEYHIDGITQSQIDEKSGFTFERGLRSLLRQDPDVMMVGEIRDRQTAQIAVEASLTGHLVLTTLHTKDAGGAIARLLDMGIEPFLLSASLTGVLAQRLVRKKCPQPKEHVESLRGVDRGRFGVFELLVVDDTIRRFIRDYADGTCSKMGSVVE